MSLPDQEISTSTNETHRRLCDFCNESTALLYCRADSAKLCMSCDREVHYTNQLFKKHNRRLLCDSCNSSPSSIFCRTESSVLCQNCDWESHKSFGPVHDRRPLEGFVGCPSVSELLNFLGFDELGKKSLVSGNGSDEEEYLGYLVWETPSIVGVDDLVVSNDSGHGFQAMGVPPLPKNRHVTCGKYKEEILSQLRGMAETEPNFADALGKFETYAVQSPVHSKHQLRDRSSGLENTADPISVPSYETSELKPYNCNDVARDGVFNSTHLDTFVEMKHIVPCKDSEQCDRSGKANGLQDAQLSNHLNSKSCQVPSKAGRREVHIQERDSAISRYKQKRKTRRYDKRIIYESRRVRAETRTRVRGRFAKADN